MNGNNSSSNYRRTPVSQLFDLDANDSGNIQDMSYGAIEPQQDPRLQKFLRKDVKEQHLRGMNGGMDSDSRHVSFIDPEEEEIIPRRYIQPQQQIISVPEPSSIVINCPMFFEHIKTCPICSKFYNTDKTIYIIIIVILSLVSIILLKRVLEK